MRQPVGSIVQMIRIDQHFLYAQPADMRSGVDRLLSLVITAHGRAMLHTAYLFANQSKSRLKVLIHDEFGVWLATRRLQQGRFIFDHLAKVPPGTKIANAIEHSLKRWTALTYFLNDGRVPIDNNHIENRIRPIAVGRGNWMFVGSERAGTRAAAMMSLIQSAKLTGHDP